MRNVLFITITVFFGVILCGCGGNKTPTGDDRIVAKVNNYEMTVADFREGLETMPVDRALSVNPVEAKKEVLENLITKRLLLQEAQKQNFDKERAFMREIERHWEQALLKLLFRKKSYDLSRDIAVEDSEIIDEYRKMKRRIYADIIILKDKGLAERLSAAGDKFEEVKESIKDKISSGKAAEWCSPGDLPQYLEEPLFSMKPGEVSRPVKSGNQWAVMRALKEEGVDIGPFEKAAPDIREAIMRRKKEEAFEKWIAALRKNANVKIDNKILE
ncbi:MAG: hypothetical protein AUJ75_04110, partial [Candidatus Omnitrophica bacterium CG1_02_49_10]